MRTDTDPERPPLRTLWTDRLGTVGTRSVQILAILALAAVAVLGMIQLKLVVIPVLIAIVIAAAAAPVIGWLRRFMPPILAAWVALLSGIVIFGGVVTLIVFAVRGQWDDLSSSALKGIDQLYDYLINGPLPIDQKQIEDARDAVIDFVTSAQFGSGALAGVSAAANIITGAVLVIVILFFFLKDGDTIWEFFLRPFRGEHLARGHRIGHTAVRVLGGYVRGTAIIALVDAFFIGLGLVILGVPLALPLAVIVFVASFVPLVGATIASGLAALVALVGTENGPVVALIVIAIAIGVNQLEGNFLQPVVMAQSLKLHPLVILVALTAGTIVAGIIGAVLAVPIAAVSWAIIKVWKSPQPTPAPVVPNPRRKKKMTPRPSA
ncbi:putative PurR-regulated permease PerM [Okibacterium sp. HSC-33S16]|uniref:AI-2E family transporter n=1 Tax=Okibacterium sp. HSC-33S16 TaxID=2910965 RepID=UPI00209E1DE5|nr:AI-2E family transporter [Okibacterium sp. HSC-33S16]MCP2030809.1 putative PurR-regulated permease PerM [Okibacterium sp. HSC-33S16]